MLFLQYCLPQHLLSKMVGWFANCRLRWLKNHFIARFCVAYSVNLQEAERSQIEDYHSFNDFFTRSLKAGARVMDANPKTIISPVDGFVSAYGKIQDKAIVQAKGKRFSLDALLADKKELSQQFRFGDFLTAYLAPANYHCFHMPLDGVLQHMIYVPGKLFSVNKNAVNNIDHLFARNERVICIFDTKIGPIAYIAVGAMLVGSMSMEWHGVVNPKHSHQIKTYSYQHAPQKISLKKGDKVGHFQMGSTVIMLLPPNKISWEKAFATDEVLRFGEKIGGFV